MSSNEKNNASGATKAFNMGGRDTDLLETQPEMRSVAIMSQAPTLGMRSPMDGPKFGKAPPIGISRPVSISKRATSSISVKQVWNEENWKVTDPLEPVPIDFPLERTHREIHGASPEVVAQRISNALRLLSVDAEYDCENAKAKCTTGDSVSFRIRLFAGGEGGLPVVVEVQRRNGSASSFMRVCRKILDGAEGADVMAEAEPARRKMPPFMKKPIGGMKCLEGLPAKFDADGKMNADIDKAMELLRSKQKDTNILGLESLCLLTDPLKTRPDIALKACKSILMESRCMDIRDEVAVNLQKDAFLPEEFDDEGGLNLAYESRHKSLVLLSNTLVLTSKDGCLADAVKSAKWFSEFLIPTLLDEVKSFETSANNAYEAACGITGLALCSDIARRVMEDNSAKEDLESSHAYGATHHELLANESERALQALGHTL